MLRLLIVIGTRPEAIKLAPLIRACVAHNGITPIVCSTGQHRELLDQVVSVFDIHPDVELGLMSSDQSLAELTARAVRELDRVLVETTPDWVVVQGDTTTTFAAALAAFYRQVPLAHVEAGLRTGDIHAPWPEEFNRCTVSRLAAIHFAPTDQAAANLRREGVPSGSILVTGNTAIDAMQWTLKNSASLPTAAWKQLLGPSQRMLLVTLHRRENHGQPLESVCAAIRCLATTHPNVAFMLPLHPSPHAGRRVRKELEGLANVHLLPPVGYSDFVQMLARSHFVLTDSGGIQEEAPTLKKPVLILRDTTERPEAVAAGAARIVGTTSRQIVDVAERLLSDDEAYKAMQIEQNPFGDGHATDRILAALLAARS